jgi:hypothetical protein
LHSQYGEDFPMKQDHFDYAGFRKLNLENSLDAIDYCVKKKTIVDNNLIFSTHFL